MLHRLHPLSLFAACLPGFAQDAADPAKLVAALSAPALRAQAHADLVELGSAAVPALIAALGKDDAALVDECAEILQAIGPDAGAAVPALHDLLAADRGKPSVVAYRAFVELLPWRPAKVAADTNWLQPVLIRFLPDDSAAIHVLHERAFVRATFAVDADLPRLVRVAAGTRAFRAELAIQLLGHRGSAARQALPTLGALLHRPDPRVLTTDVSVPIRDLAARAILAIAPDDDLAVTASAELHGKLPLEAAPLPQFPERALARAATLVAELGRAETRGAAEANLIALGRVAVPPLLAALQQPQEPESLDAMLRVLCELGPTAVDAVPLLAEQLIALPARHTATVLRALTTTLPCSRDEVLWWYSSSLGSVRVLGHAIPGPMDLDEQNAIHDAFDSLGIAKSVAPDSTAAELAEVVADPSVLNRELALRFARTRGAELRALLPQLAPLLTEAQPQLHRHHWRADGSSAPVRESRDAIVHRLAAQAILAIAAPDDPLVAAARAVLAAPPSK